MQVILPDEQIHQIQLLLSNLINKEIREQLDKSGIDSPYLNKQQACNIFRYIKQYTGFLDCKRPTQNKIGKTIRFHKDAIDQWLNSHN